MGVFALIKKEAYTVRRHLGVFILLLIIFPGMLTLGTGMYDRTIPEDIPVAIVPAEEDTTDDDISIIRGGVVFFATPITYDDAEAARDDLQREQVYLILEVPPGLTDSEQNATFTMVSDWHFVPFQEPANLTEDILSRNLDASLPATIHVEHERDGHQRGLSSFLVPAVLVIFAVLYAAVYVPHQLHRERVVLERVRTETRLETAVAAKVAVHTALLLVPLLIVGVVAHSLDYDVNVLNPLAVSTYVLTVLGVAAMGLAILFVVGLRRRGLIVNTGLAAAVIATAGLIYPVGFFAPIEQTISRSNPVHYATISLRSSMLRDAPATLYLDYLGYLAATLVVSVVALTGAIMWYRRRW